MGRKFEKIGALIMTAGIALGSHAFAAQYVPYPEEEKPEFNDAVALPEPAFEYTEEDAKFVLDSYNQLLTLDREQMEKYDMNKDGVVNSLDASIILDRCK